MSHIARSQTQGVAVMQQYLSGLAAPPPNTDRQVSSDRASVCSAITAHGFKAHRPYPTPQARYNRRLAGHLLQSVEPCFCRLTPAFPSRHRDCPSPVFLQKKDFAFSAVSLPQSKRSNILWCISLFAYREEIQAYKQGAPEQVFSH